MLLLLGAGGRADRAVFLLETRAGGLCSVVTREGGLAGLLRLQEEEWEELCNLEPAPGPCGRCQQPSFAISVKDHVGKVSPGT